jgi:4-hydroxy-2-oxoheptanedioate aldolase
MDGGKTLRSNDLRSAFAAGRSAVNGWVSSASPLAAETLSHAGFDCITVDLQHGMFGVDGAIALIHAVGSGPAMPMARCPSLDPTVIGKLLDAGAYGIICPSVDTADQAAALVAACRYPPTGRRSFGPARGLLYGGPDYVAHADETVLVWAMVESVESVANLDAILAVPGLDGVFIGPNDLALSMGHAPGGAQPVPPVAAAIERIRVTARSAGVRTGIFCASAELAARMIADGWDLVTPGNDMSILASAAAQRVATARAGGAVPLPASPGPASDAAPATGY